MVSRVDCGYKSFVVGRYLSKCIAHAQESPGPAGKGVANTHIKRVIASPAAARHAKAMEDPRAVMLVRKSAFVFVGNVLNISCGLIEECEHHLLQLQTHATTAS